MSNRHNKPTISHFYRDLIIIVLIYYFSYMFKYNSFDNTSSRIFLPNIKEYSFILLLWVASITISFRIKGLHPTDENLTIPEMIQRVVKSLFYATVPIAVVIFLLKYKFFSRKVFFGSFFLFCIFLSAWRIGMRPKVSKRLVKIRRYFLNILSKLRLLFDLVIIALIYYSSYVLTFNSFDSILTGQISLPYIKGYSFILLPWAASIIILFRREGLYPTGKNLTVPKVILRVVKSIFYATVPIAVLIFLLKYDFFSRKVFLGSSFLFCIFLSAWRIGIRPRARKWLARMLRSFSKILLVCTTKIGRAIGRLLLKIGQCLKIILIGVPRKIGRAIIRLLLKIEQCLKIILIGVPRKIGRAIIRLVLEIIPHRLEILLINPLKKIARAVKKLLLRILQRLKIILAPALRIAMTVKTSILNKIDRIIRFFLYLLISVLPFSKAGVEICIVIALSLWIIKRLLLKTAKLQESILNLPIFAYLSVGLFSVGRSLYFGASLHAFFAKFIEGILLYFIIIEVVKKRKHISIIIGLLLCATAVVCMDGIIQGIFTGTDIFRHMPIVRGGITGAFNHKNDLGGYLLIPLLIVSGLILNRLHILKRKWRAVSNKPLLLGMSVLLCLFTITMALTNSRGAWLALLLGVLISYFLISRRIVVSIAMLYCLALALFILSNIYAINEPKSINFNMQQDTIARVYYWKDALTMIKERPFFGNGINTYMRIVAEMHKARDPAYAHNCYLQMAAEIGIIGLASFLWIIARLFSRCIPVIKSWKSELKFLLMGLLYGLSAFLVHSFIDTNLYSLQLNIFFWYMVALTICVHRQSGKAE